MLQVSTLCFFFLAVGLPDEIVFGLKVWWVRVCRVQRLEDVACVALFLVDVAV